MWAKFRTSIKKGKHTDDKQPCTDTAGGGGGLSVNEEYLCAVRTKSFADFFLQVQKMSQNPLSTSPSGFPQFSRISETLLNPGQETIASLLDSSPIFSNFGVKSLLTDYFDVSAQASSFCSQLLETLTRIQSDYAAIRKAFSGVDSAAQLASTSILTSADNNPFSEQDFNRIHGIHSFVLQHLRSKRKKVARRIKLIKFFNKASGVCVTAAAAMLAAAAVFLAVHTLTAVMIGPAVLILPIGRLKRRVRNLRFLKYGFLIRVVKQLDVAAKGAYILDRDFDTMSRLVSRLQDEMDHGKALIRFCVERALSKKEEDNNSRVSYQVLQEIKKCELEFKQQIEELEEHVYLCLVTINKARALVVEEICRDCCGEQSVP